MDVDLTQSLKDTENALRDFIGSVLEKANGPKWYESCGVSPEKLQKWNERRDVEVKRQPGGVVEPRLIYYADFYDLLTILEKKWDSFSAAFGDLKTMRVYLEALTKLRDPDAHRRELLPHQKHLALGIGGEIRSRIIRFRSKLETKEDCFPRIESARDSLGNIYVAGSGMAWVQTNQVLRPDDGIDYVVTASDPFGDTLSYRSQINQLNTSEWQSENSLSVRVRTADIGQYFNVVLQIKSPRDYHASSSYDDRVEFVYTVLPRKTA
jgi:hypothetical protein